jgi:hypothetical protein
MLGWGEALLGVGEAIPGLGSAVSATEALFHGGEAVYDGVHGDRDGAVHNGVEALVNGVAAIPGVGEVVGLADVALGLGSGGTSVAERLGDGAVAATDSIFGAPKDFGDGTRSGEMAAGLNAAAPMLLGPLGLPLGLANVFSAGNDGSGTVQGQIKKLVERADPGSATDPTSGHDGHLNPDPPGQNPY